MLFYLFGRSVQDVLLVFQMQCGCFVLSSIRNLTSVSNLTCLGLGVSNDNNRELKGKRDKSDFRRKERSFIWREKYRQKLGGKNEEKVRSARAVLILKRTVYWGQAYTIRAYSPNAKVSVAGSCLSLSAERGDRSYKAQSKILEGSVFQSVWWVRGNSKKWWSTERFGSAFIRTDSHEQI